MLKAKGELLKKNTQGTTVACSIAADAVGIMDTVHASYIISVVCFINDNISGYWMSLSCVSVRMCVRM